MPDEKKEEKVESQIDDLLHPSIGGKKVGQLVPVKSGKQTDFSSIPGVRCVLPPPSRTEAETNPEESVEKESDARE